jgi:sec-independent protein translocase protein TatC
VGFGVVHYENYLGFLIRPALRYLPDGKLAVFHPMTPFMVEIKLALILGGLLTAPLILYQIWALFSPMLEARQKRVILPTLCSALFLFLAGASLAYFGIIPMSLKVLYSFQTATATWRIGLGEYTSFALLLLLGFGAIFELPVVIMVLTLLGIVTPAFLRTYRRHFIVVMTVLACLINPGEPVTLAIVTLIPMLILYEVGVILAVLISPPRPKTPEIEIPSPA